MPTSSMATAAAAVASRSIYNYKHITTDFRNAVNGTRTYASGVIIGGSEKTPSRERESVVSPSRAFPPTTLAQAVQQKLEWRESVLEDGSILYRHPTHEQVMSVKMARMLVYREVSKRKRELRRKEQAMRAQSEEYVPRKTKKQEEADERKIVEQVHRDIMSSTNTLSPEAIAEVRRLRTVDPITYNSQNLARMFQVKPELINMVSRDPEEKVKHELRVLKEWNRNRPRRSTRQSLNS